MSLVKLVLQRKVNLLFYCAFWYTSISLLNNRFILLPFEKKVDGAWTTWNSWGTCTVTCGGGTQDRTRSCTNPAPQYNGAACASNGLETQACNTQVCISK